MLQVNTIPCNTLFSGISVNVLKILYYFPIPIYIGIVVKHSDGRKSIVCKL